MKKVILSISIILLMCACGGQTQKPTQENDSATASVEKAEAKKASAESIPDFVTSVYDKVNEVMSKQVVNTSVLDSAFFAPSYKDLYKKVLKAEEGKSFDNMCFIEYMPFTQGLIVPITITDIKANMLTDNTAEVFYEMKDKEDVVKMWWHLVYANGEWRIDDWKNDPDAENSMGDRMREYLEKNK
ncbi:MAG: hypothetical protein J5735_01495 [Prevotella sp.]|nr:hypothetical protein [Prevotella sp.]